MSANQNPRGSENLEAMEAAKNYLFHVGRIVRDELPSEGAIIDFGAGSGSQTSYVLPPTNRIRCLEVDQELHGKIASRGYSVIGSLDDIMSESLRGIFSINCLEHIEDDGHILKCLQQKLESGGVIVIFVPAFQFLYSKMDDTVGHYRRYAMSRLSQVLLESGFEIRSKRYVDSVGFLAAFLYKILRRNGEPSRRSIRLYDRWVFPLSVVLDRLFSGLAGKNILMVGVKI